MSNAAAPRRRMPRPIARFPLVVYRLGLGWLLGHRFVRLEHIGRSTGAARQAVLEVIHHEPGQVTVMSGFGRRSNWFRNVERQPEVHLTMGRRRFPAVAEILDHDATVAALDRFRREHPREVRPIARTWGIDPRDPAATTGLAEHVPVVVFREHAG